MEQHVGNSLNYYRKPLLICLTKICKEAFAILSNYLSPKEQENCGNFKNNPIFKAHKPSGVIKKVN